MVALGNVVGGTVDVVVVLAESQLADLFGTLTGVGDIVGLLVKSCVLPELTRGFGFVTEIVGVYFRVVEVFTTHHSLPELRVLIVGVPKLKVVFAVAGLTFPQTSR